ncbi:MAG: haloacid dehalogenase-like hydrolase [Firmicutes bacterium]|nr:haloacid dehalogenase-like hydrolase [Bacillota bacterium]
MEKKHIIAFDFDGTITTKDTLLEFIKFSKGQIKFIFGFLLFSPLLIAYKLKIYSNWKLKQQIFSYFFKGMSLSAFNEICEDFAGNNQHIIRPKAMKQINEYLKQNFEIIIISASIKNWIIPFANRLRINNIISTEIEINDHNVLTGKFSTFNCYGKEKVNRLLKDYPDRENYYLIAFGDSEGDRELFNFANEKYYRALE